ncbi:unnamed protein product [Mucor hiemalis]
MYSSKIKNSNSSSSGSNSKRNKRFKVYHHQRPSLPSLHQIFPSPPPQIVLPPLISLHSLPLFRDFNELLYPHPFSQNSDEQILEGASIFFFGNSQHLQTPPPSASSSTASITRNKRGDFVLFDSKDSPPSTFKGKLVPDLGRH